MLIGTILLTRILLIQCTSTVCANSAVYRAVSSNCNKSIIKKIYFLEANSVLITKLVDINKKHKKKYQKCEDYTVMPLCGNKEEFVVHPKEKNVRECNVLEGFYVTKYNQYNWIIPRGKFFSYVLFVFNS